MKNIIKEIENLKKEKDFAILAHYYVDEEIQNIADYIGDSYYLSKIAMQVTQQNIMMCGVLFMGESVKLLNPNKNVIVAELSAGCPMAEMANIEKIKEVRKNYEDVAVVCYVNSNVELKAHSDVCVTSANALSVVKKLPNKNIFFIPDENLGRYVANKIPEKQFIFNKGYCHVHTKITSEALLKCKELHQNAEILVHPECLAEIVELADFVGSTSGIINYAAESNGEEFIICTEKGILKELQDKSPSKIFYFPNENQECPDMKKITLEKVYNAMLHGNNVIEINNEFNEKANLSLKRMLELAE